MKLYKYLFTAAALLMLFSACESDLDGVTYDPNNVNVKSGEITASANDIVLTAATNKETVLELSWSKSDFAIPVAITYFIQMDYKGEDFSNAHTLASTTDTSVSFLGNELNKAFLALQTLKNPDAEVNYDAKDVDIRLISYFTEGGDTLKSNILSMNITPYAGRLEYKKLSVPGSHQGWDPANYTQALYAIGGGSVYEGYIYMPAGTEFKFADGSWEVNWGSSDGATLAAGGDNIKAEEGGCYYLKVDTENLTMSMELRNWGIVGDAVGSWENDVMMEYDATNNIYRATIEFVDGEFKFRANKDWGVNLGIDTNGEAGDLIANGANIPALPGQYTITLNFVGGYYVYKLYAGDDIVEFPILSLPGSMNEWDPSTKKNILASINSDGNYEGYIYLSADAQFKIADGSWDVNWGSTDATTLVSGGDNIVPTDGEGFYLIKANPEDLSMSMLKTTWSIIGDAVGGWETANDVVMTWNAKKGLLEATVDMAANAWKFRANGGWDYNFGDDANGGITHNGSNFTIEEAGTYYITLDLTTRAGNYQPTFTITKQ